MAYHWLSFSCRSVWVLNRENSCPATASSSCASLLEEPSGRLARNSLTLSRISRLVGYRHNQGCALMTATVAAAAADALTERDQHGHPDCRKLSQWPALQCCLTGILQGDS